jgi:hypothetical protein
VVAHTFGALAGLDLVDLNAHVNGVIRALGLADIAVDAFVSDPQRHRSASPATDELGKRKHAPAVPAGATHALPFSGCHVCDPKRHGGVRSPFA